MLILFKLQDEEINAEKIITVRSVSYCSYEKRAWKNFQASLGFEPPAFCDTRCRAHFCWIRSGQELRNSFCFLVFVIVVVMVVYIKLLSIVKHHDRQVLSILSNDWWIRLWFSWFLLKADHSWVLNYDIRWSANFFFVLFQIFVFIIFSFISTLLGLEIVSYYTYTGAAHWSVYLSSRNYLIIASVTYFFAVVEIIIGICAVYVSLLLRRNVRYLIFLLPVSRSCIIHRFKALNTEKTGPFKETMKCL